MTAARSDLMALADRLEKAAKDFEECRDWHGNMEDSRDEPHWSAQKEMDEASVAAKEGASELRRLAASQPDRADAVLIERCAKIAEPWPGFTLDENSTEADRAVVAVRTEIANSIRSLAVAGAAGTKSDGASCHTRRLDDLGSVQDGLKMSTDGQRTDTLDMSSSERRDVNPDVTAGETAPSPSDSSPGPDVREAARAWHLGALNDGFFIINESPRPSNDDAWHDRPDGPTLVLNVTDLPDWKAKHIIDAHNAAIAALTRPLGGFVQGSIAAKQSPSSTSATATELGGRIIFAVRQMQSEALAKERHYLTLRDTDSAANESRRAATLEKLAAVINALVAQGIEQGSSKPEVAGSIPAERASPHEISTETAGGAG